MIRSSKQLKLLRSEEQDSDRELNGYFMCLVIVITIRCMSQIVFQSKHMHIDVLVEHECRE